MEQNCQNCGQSITENFCGNCGQKKFKRIDGKYLSDEIQYTLLHTNKGFLYSIKKIIKNPGKTAREFIDGNRVNHYKPILLAFVLSGISAFISFKVIGLKDIMSQYYDNLHISSQFMNDYATITSSYNSIIMLLHVPFYAFITKLVFRKWGHNYYEHVVMTAYILSFYTLINIIILYPIIYFLKDSPAVVIPLTSTSIMAIPFLIVWFYKEFYPTKSLQSIILRVLLIILITIGFFMILMIILTIVAFIVAMILGPEVLDYLKPQ